MEHRLKPAQQPNKLNLCTTGMCEVNGVVRTCAEL